MGALPLALRACRARRRRRPWRLQRWLMRRWVRWRLNSSSLRNLLFGCILGETIELFCRKQHPLLSHFHGPGGHRCCHRCC